MKNFIVYKSSAGSGKTFTLVLEFLKLCLHDVKALKYNYKKILAITFTNKAASEMKSRVIEALNHICLNDELNVMGQELQKLLNIDAIELKRRAEIVLSQILHHYSDFSIGTIDSFTHRLVKTFAFDLKLPNNFNIEMDTQGFHHKVIALLMNKIGEDDYISHLLKEFASINAENNDAWDPEKQLKEFTNLLIQENANEFIQKLNHFSADELENFRKQFNDFIKFYENNLKTDANKAIKLITSNGLNDEDFIYGKAGPQNFFKKCLNLNVKNDDVNGTRLVNAINLGKWWSKNVNPQAKQIEDQLTQSAQQLIAFIEQNYQSYSLTKILAKQMYALMLLKKIEEISQTLKNEEHVVFLSEFNQKISDIITNEPTPFIYERLGEKYHHYLIDEFQDTSSLQWHNLIPLLENALAGGWQNLLVGDGKQSIYRWRNANVIQFAALPKISNPTNNALLAQHQQTFTRNFEEKNLNTNFRSKENVIEFNNQFFEFLSNKVLTPTFQSIYHKHQQQYNSKAIANDNKGYVSIEVLNNKEQNKEEFYLEKLLRYVESAIQKGYAYEDICVLVRKNQHGSIVAQQLSAASIPVISSDSLLLKNNLEVNTVLACLEYQLDSNNHISAAVIINYFFTKKQLNATQYHQCLEALHQHQSLKNILLPYNLDVNFETINLNNVFDTCIDALKFLKLDLHASPYIRFFLDEVAAFLNQHNASVSKFLEWWLKRKEKSSLIIPKGSNAVSVMTIHSSKGLEFPVVIIPFCDWALNQKSNKWVHVDSNKTTLPVAVINLTQGAAAAGFETEVEEENQEQLLDNLNLLYVAFTRAVDKLHILSAANRNQQSGVYAWISAFMLQSKNVFENKLELGIDANNERLSKKNQKQDYALNDLSFDSNNQVIKIKSSYTHDEALFEASKKGILLHQLLANVYSVEDIHLTVTKAIQQGLISMDEQNAITEKLNHIVEHPFLKEYFDRNKTFLIEKELIHVSGELMRPDRILITQNEATILDYKTGKKNLKKHQQQIIKYAEALTNMGFVQIKKILIYLDDMEIVEVN